MAIPHLQIDEQHRLRAFAPIAICSLGLLVTLVAGVFESVRMTAANQQQQAIAAGVESIARNFSTRVDTPHAPTAPAAAPDDRALNAARAKLAQQGEELTNLHRQLSGPTYRPANPDVLYKGDVPIAVVESPTIDAAAKRMVFKSVVSHSDLDLTTRFLFRTWSIRCAATTHARTISGGNDRVKYWNLPCAIEP